MNDKCSINNIYNNQMIDTLIVTSVTTRSEVYALKLPHCLRPVIL